MAVCSQVLAAATFLPGEDNVFGPVEEGHLLSRRRGPHCIGPLLLFILMFVSVFSGCANRPGPETLVPVPARTSGGKNITVFAVTNRTRTGMPPAFGSGRGVMTFEQFTMQTVGSTPGSGDTAAALSRESDPSKSFITVGRHEHDRNSFEASVNHMRKANANNVVVFVHGYNNSYQEAVFRLAQLRAETGAQAVPVLFSWPSQADFRGYIADRDSTTYARDDLVELLTMLSRSYSGGRVIVVGHSMGAWLVMEALRQLRLEARNDVIARLQVGLASPDIDVDVFRKQIAVVGRLSPPLTVLVSNDDRALAASSRLTGGKPRLGAVKVDDPEIQKIATLNGVQIIDITKLPSNDAFNHDRFVTFAARYSTAERSGATGGVRQAGVFLLDATGRLLSAPFNGTAQILAADH